MVSRGEPEHGFYAAFGASFQIAQFLFQFLELVLIHIEIAPQGLGLELLHFADQFILALNILLQLGLQNELSVFGIKALRPEKLQILFIPFFIAAGPVVQVSHFHAQKPEAIEVGGLGKMNKIGVAHHGFHRVSGR